MKKTLLTIVIAFYGYCSYAQTNTFPSSGNVGIGTTSPIAPLDINGTTAQGIHFERSGADLGQIDFSSYDLNVSSNVNNMRFLVPGGGPVFSFMGGNLGIGTTSPGSQLTIKNSGTGVSISPGGNPYFGTLAFNRESASGAIFDPSGYAYQINNGGPDANLHFQVYNGSGSLVTGNALVISGSNGNVGIGTTTPDTKLAVNGTIHTKEVKVDLTGWPDYVFKKNYRLIPLSEVKTYIEKNQHLPEMPSEQEVAKDGINLGEMNKLLTKKVEELTLYLIEKDKQVSDLNKQLANQQQQIELLKQQQNQRIAALEAALSKLTPIK